MPDRSPDSLLDILELIERIERHTAGMTEAVFLADIDAQDATAYRLLAIGEAVRTVGETVKARHTHIPWSQIVGMRNLLAHEYFVRESAILWATIRTGLPPLAKVCRFELGLDDPGDES
jgi:uncharacterized protein with HEPN domain